MNDLTDDDVFRRRVEDAINSRGVADIHLANSLSVSRATVRRWALGEAAPHPGMRKPVYEAIERLALEGQP